MTHRVGRILAAGAAAIRAAGATTIAGAAAVLAAGALAGCTVNPVTGERELALVSPAQEIAIGEEQYFPSQQMQDGEYVSDPGLTRYVDEIGQRLAAVSDRALPYEFVVLNSSVPNAWALPGGKIAVNRGLLVELGSEAELAAVLGHEIVHAAARHGAQAMQRGMLLQSAILVAGLATHGDSNAVVGAASLGAVLINQRNGREAELEADLYGMRYMARSGYAASAAVTLQETFVRLAGDAEQNWLEGLFASHPPSDERVRANRATAATLPANGELGQERYATAIASLRGSRDAYATYDRAREALAEDDLDEAERLATDAARALADEGHVHALLGDIDLRRGRFPAAAAHYANAIARNDRFFHYHLGKGLAHEGLGELDAAETSLQASIALLPTADAYYGLGQVAEQRGNRVAALEHYRQAAHASTAAGSAARDAVVRLDMPANPGNYVALRTGLDSAGQLRIEVGNPNRLPIADIVVLIRYVAPDGAIRQARRSVAGPLAPQGTVTFATGLGPFTSPEGYEVVIEAARAVTD